MIRRLVLVVVPGALAVALVAQVVRFGDTWPGSAGFAAGCTLVVLLWATYSGFSNAS